MIFTLLAYVLLAFFFGLELFARKGGQARSIQTGKSGQNTTVWIGVSYPIPILLPLLLNYLAVGKLPYAGLIGAVGDGLMALGLVIRLWAMLTLGQFYTRSLTTLENQNIVRGGPYRLVRHPGYLGTLLIWTGLPVSQANWIAIVVVMAVMGAIYANRMKAEEAMLLGRFGDQYRQYMLHTRRLIPLIY
jgi:protein-S-isoprenylcysteine O-methyltransferase